MIGNGTGDWDVPVGGMGAVTAALEGAARTAGAELFARGGGRGARPWARAASTSTCAPTEDGASYAVRASQVLANVAPATLARLLGEPAGDPPPQGAQLKVNMLLRAPAAPARELGRSASGVRGHVPHQRGLRADRSRARPGRGRRAAGPAAVRDLLPLADRLVDPRAGARRRRGADADAVRAAHAGGPVPGGQRRHARARTARRRCARWTACSTSRSRTACGRGPTGRASRPGRRWTSRRSSDSRRGTSSMTTCAGRLRRTRRTSGRWGVETASERVLLCGAGARRGGGVSGIPGRAAAMALLSPGG